MGSSAPANAGTLRVVHCSREHAVQWDDFVMREEGATFYHRFAWKRINEHCFGHDTFYVAAIEEGKIVGVLPMVLLRSVIFGRILCSMPFVNLGGPCSSRPDVSALLMDEARTILAATRAKFLEVRTNTKLGADMTPSEHKVSMTVDLTRDPSQLWNAFTSKHRNNIRRAQGHGYQTVAGGAELLDSCYEILQESWRNLGTPLYAKSYFKEIVDAFPGSMAIFVATHEGRPVGTAINGHHRATAEGMWAGAVTDHRRSDLNYVLYWDMIRYYCEAGFARFHLGRSTAQSGAEAFKKKWLAASTQLYWYHVSADGGRIPQLNVSNPRFQFAIRTWQRLPLAVTRAIGPMISKGIP